MPVRCGVLNLRSPPCIGRCRCILPSPACRLHVLLLLAAGFFASAHDPRHRWQAARPLLARAAASSHVSGLCLLSPCPSPPFPLHWQKFPPEREKDAVSAEQLHEGGRHAVQTTPRARPRGSPCSVRHKAAPLLCSGGRSPGKISPVVKGLRAGQRYAAADARRKTNREDEEARHVRGYRCTRCQPHRDRAGTSRRDALARGWHSSQRAPALSASCIMGGGPAREPPPGTCRNTTGQDRSLPLRTPTACDATERSAPDVGPPSATGGTFHDDRAASADPSGPGLHCPDR